MTATYISFEPIEWTQEVSDYPNINVEGRNLNANCKATGIWEVLLDGKVDLRNFASIPIGIRDGSPGAEKLEEQGLSKLALGRLHYMRDQNFLHGWFYLKKSEWFTAVWDQVRDGGYLSCIITLGVVGLIDRGGPETWIWNTDHPLSIESVSLQFNRKTYKPSDQAAPRTGLFGRRLAR